MVIYSKWIKDLLYKRFKNQKPRLIISQTFDK